MDKIHDKQFGIKFGVKFGDNEKQLLLSLNSNPDMTAQDSGDIIILEQKGNNNIYYGRKK